MNNFNNKMTEYELTECQATCFDAFKNGRSLFMTGPAGCGKSFLVKKINQYCSLKNISIGITALTGAAAALINGTTLHSWAGIGLALAQAPELHKKMNKAAILRWRETSVLIIDEISMMSSDLFNKLNDLAKLIMNNARFFGGIQVILCGDFAQLKPISNDSNAEFCFQSQVWKEFLTQETYYLNKVMRQRDPVFQNILANARLGKITEHDKTVLDSRLISDLSEADLFVEMADGTRQLIKGTLLYPKKKDVSITNNTELAKLIRSGAENKTYLAVDTIVDKKSKVLQDLSEAHIDILNKCCQACDNLVLAIGAQVMLIKNLDTENGLVNGSRGVIVEFHAVSTYPVVMFDNGIQQTIAIEPFETESGKVVLIRKQIPLILAWALTIHKCQGATISNVITDLRDVFEEAQVYVTLSRACTLEGLFILGINYSKVKCNQRVKKYYEELEV